MTAPNPIDNPDLYDRIQLGGVKSPGVVTLSGHDRVIKWDVKSGPSLSGAVTSLKEVPPIEFSASFYLADADDFADWVSFQAVIESTVNGTKTKALPIYHPDLASQVPPISSVVKASVAGVVHDKQGGQTIVVKFQEYRPPKPKSTAPVGKDPDAALLAELKELTEQYKKTPWG